MKMGKTHHGWANAGRAAAAVLTLAALLISPVCAPLCAAKACSSAPVRGEECYGQGAAASNTGGTCVTPAKVCGARELTAVLLKADDRLVQAGQLQITSAKLAVDTRLGASPAIFGAPVLRWGEDHSSPGPANSLLQTTHLRF